jgi:hypothetical protein
MISEHSFLVSLVGRLVSHRSRYLVAGIVLGGMAVLAAGQAIAHDHNHPELDSWYKSLMQPDNPTASCCGVADAYWCDDIHVRDGKTYCRITDDRPDLPSGRVHREVGDEFEIPPNKLKWDAGNPTGHAVIFLRVDGMVWCFVQGSGT